MPNSHLAVVGDVGGTHARFGLADLARPVLEIEQPLTFLCADYESGRAALTAYLDRLGVSAMPGAVAIAVAGPVVEGAMSFTNMSWRLSEADLRAFGFGRAALINDYGALALAAPHLTPADWRALGPDLPASDLSGANGGVAVLGAGTGFGASLLARDGRGQAIVSTEGGHIAFAPSDEIEIQVLQILSRSFGRVSVERILSGPGLVNLHRALCEISGMATSCDSPADISASAMAGEKAAMETLERFCAIFGAVSGDFALSYGAQGGVYLAGGIAPRLLGVLQTGAFRSRFEAKGRFRDYMAAIPTRVVTHPYLALLGAAHLLQTPSPL
jgi:glucokinase